MEDSAFDNQRIVKRRLIGAEVRRIHIIYFLSRIGCNEHPHLIRIHHLSKNGIRLKDIKRWMGEVRGKDMPESFAWSFKRTYKTGYVWQDLLDDDLVTPISDNEYVLKGSEISSTTNTNAMEKEQESAQDSQEASSKLLEDQTCSSDVVSPSIEVEDSSPTFGSETSILTDVSGKDELEKNSDIVNQEPNSSTFLTRPVLNEEKSRSSINTAAGSSDKPHFRKSGMFRNLITCGTVDTIDSAVVVANKRSRRLLNMCSSHSAVGVKNSAKKKGQFGEQRVYGAAYKPLYGPNCAQCGKRFKPEKLHSHMKSCKGMKAFRPAAENISIAPRNEGSVSGYLLAH